MTLNVIQSFPFLSELSTRSELSLLSDPLRLPPPVPSQSVLVGKVAEEIELESLDLEKKMDALFLSSFDTCRRRRANFLAVSAKLVQARHLNF